MFYTCTYFLCKCGDHRTVRTETVNKNSEVKKENTMNYQRDYLVKKDICKDSRYKKLSGVCAGIAKHYNLPRIGVRIAAICALITFPVASGVAYIVAAILLPTSH